MRLRLIAVGSRMPKWVEEGWHEYAKRLPAELSLDLMDMDHSLVRKCEFCATSEVLVD